MTDENRFNMGMQQAEAALNSTEGMAAVAQAILWARTATILFRDAGCPSLNASAAVMGAIHKALLTMELQQVEVPDHLDALDDEGNPKEF